MVEVAIVRLAGVMAMETSFGAMVKLNEPLTALILAAIETVPLACAVSMPPAAIVARPDGDALQVTDEVRSLVLWSLYLPVAVSCEVCPTMRFGLLTATLMETRTGVLFPLPEPPPAHPKAASKAVSTMANNTLRVEVIGE